MNPQPVQSGKMPVVLDPLAVGSIIAAAVTVSAEDAQRDRSFLNRENRGTHRCKASSRLWMTDSLAGGLETSPFDAEGVPSQRTPLVERGVLAFLPLRQLHGKQRGDIEHGNASRGTFGSRLQYRPQTS